MTKDRNTCVRSLEPIRKLMEIVDRLKAPDGCPWDREQTPPKLAVYLVEEVFELLDAIEKGDIDSVREEMGDVLFLLVFMACLFAENGSFDMMDAAREAAEKMIRRHPHVFGDHALSTADEVRGQWRAIKRNEKPSAVGMSILDSIPVNQPAMFRAYQVSKRAARVGFDWRDINGVVDKTEEEWAEFREALKHRNPSVIGEEFGDLLFTLVNLGRHAGIHPEQALLGATQKFEARFRYMEKTLAATGRDIESIGDVELDELWERTKADEK